MDELLWSQRHYVKKKAKQSARKISPLARSCCQSQVYRIRIKVPHRGACARRRHTMCCPRLHNAREVATDHHETYFVELHYLTVTCLTYQEKQVSTKTTYTRGQKENTPVVARTGCRRPPVLTSMLNQSWNTPLVCYCAAAFHASSFNLLYFCFLKCAICFCCCSVFSFDLCFCVLPCVMCFISFCGGGFF